MGYTSTNVIVIWWDPTTNNIQYTSSFKFNKYNYETPTGKVAPGFIC